MSISKDEARLKLLDHVAELLIYFLSDENTPEEELQDVIMNCEDIAGLLIMSMNAEIQQIKNENSFSVSVELTNPVDFIRSLSERTIVGD